MAAVHILTFGEMAGFIIVPYMARHVKKVCNIKVCNMKKILHTFIQYKYMGTLCVLLTLFLFQLLKAV